MPWYLCDITPMSVLYFYRCRCNTLLRGRCNTPFLPRFSNRRRESFPGCRWNTPFLTPGTGKFPPVCPLFHTGDGVVFPGCRCKYTVLAPFFAPGTGKYPRVKADNLFSVKFFLCGQLLYIFYLFMIRLCILYKHIYSSIHFIFM